MVGPTSLTTRADAGARLSLRANFSWVVSGRIAEAVSKWFILLALTRYFSPEAIGLYALGLAVSNPIFLFTNLGLRTVQASDTGHLYPFSRYLGLRITTSAGAMLLLLAFVLVAGYGLEKVAIVMAIGFAKFFESICDVIYGLLQKNERMDRVGQSLIIRAVISVIAMIAAVHWTRTLVGGVAAMAASWGFFLALFDMPHARKQLSLDAVSDNSGGGIRPDFNLHKSLSLARGALPLGIAGVLLALTQSIPRVVVEAHLGEVALGLFAAIAYLAVPGGLIVTSMGNAALPVLSQRFARGQTRSFFSLVLKLVGLAAVLGLFGVIAAYALGYYVLLELYGLQYASHSDLLAWLMIGAAFVYVTSVLGYAIAATRRFSKFAAAYSIWVVVTILLSYCLIPTFGLTGAAWTTIGVGVSGLIISLVILTMVQLSPTSGRTKA